jgi:hypothetical protein
MKKRGRSDSLPEQEKKNGTRTIKDSLIILFASIPDNQLFFEHIYAQSTLF